VDQFTDIALNIGLTLFTIAVCVAIEQFSAIERYSLPARIPGALMNGAGVIFSIALVWPIHQLWGRIDPGAIMVIPLWQWLQRLGGLGYALQFLLLILIADFLAYWRHRAEHRWFWPIHVVHHAPHELHAANDIGHPVQVLFSVVFISLPMSLIQIDGPATPFVVGFVVGLLSYYIHSPIDVHFGPLRKVMVDNRYHRIHHSLEPKHFDKNFGICFSLWDRMFGTAYDPEPEEWPAVGVAGVKPPRTLGDYLTLPALLLRPGKAARAQAPAHDSCVQNP
jgi:sterol desaturase/sphingolipid hydroxylase (fatty acid hydroxylase superfamily)